MYWVDGAEAKQPRFLLLYYSIIVQSFVAQSQKTMKESSSINYYINSNLWSIAHYKTHPPSSFHKSPQALTTTSSIKYYRPSSIVIVALSNILQSGLLDDVSVSVRTLLNAKPGCLGVGNEASSVVLANISSTCDINGRSSGFSCTHRSPTLMHLNTPSELNEPFIVSSANSKHFPSFHKLHACRTSTSLFLWKLNWQIQLAYILDEVSLTYMA